MSQTGRKHRIHLPRAMTNSAHMADVVAATGCNALAWLPSYVWWHYFYLPPWTQAEGLVENRYFPKETAVSPLPVLKQILQYWLSAKFPDRLLVFINSVFLTNHQLFSGCVSYDTVIQGDTSIVESGLVSSPDSLIKGAVRTILGAS